MVGHSGKAISHPQHFQPEGGGGGCRERGKRCLSWTGHRGSCWEVGCGGDVAVGGIDGWLPAAL